jgi:hypothetical protein
MRSRRPEKTHKEIAMETRVDADSMRTGTLAVLAVALFFVHCSSSPGEQSHTGPGDSGTCSARGGCGSSAGSDARSPTDSGTSHDGPSPGDGPTSKDGPTGDAGMPVTIEPAFYVSTTGLDSNPGTLSAPFLTLAKAQGAMQASSSIKTTYIRAGSYLLPSLDCGGGGNCGLNLIAADEGETWSYYPPDGVDSADFTGGSTSASTGLVVAIYVSGGNITINGLSIHDFAYAGINSNGGADNLVIENNLLFNQYYASNDSNPGAISIVSCASVTISHNVIHDVAMLGASVVATVGDPDISNLLMTGNVVYNTCTANADCGALYVQDVTATATNLRVTNNYIHDGNTFAGLGSNDGAGLYADDCTSNLTESGNVLTGRNGSNTMMVHGGSNVHQTGNLTDLATYGQHVAVFQTSGASGCSSGVMSGNEYENNVIIGGGGGGGYSLLSGSPMNSPTIQDNDYYSYGSTAISSGTGAYGDSDPVSENPQISGWTYDVASASPVFASPVDFTALVGGWGPPGYVLPKMGTPPSSPH